MTLVLLAVCSLLLSSFLLPIFFFSLFPAIPGFKRLLHDAFICTKPILLLSMLPV